MMEQVRLGAVWPMENWLGSSLNQIQGWTTFEESYSRALEQGSLLPTPSFSSRCRKCCGGESGVRLREVKSVCSAPRNVPCKPLSAVHVLVLRERLNVGAGGKDSPIDVGELGSK